MTNERWRVEVGDCLDVLRRMPAESIDAVVTDPPYGLSVEPDIAEVLTHWLAGDDYKHRGGGFMGQTWDSFVPGPAVWRECRRVLKPGGMLLVFGGTRTVDLLTTAIRLAGFEIRDRVLTLNGHVLGPEVDWIYGSGWPKSRNIAKAIDKRRDEDAEPVRVVCRYLRAAMDERGMTSRDVAGLFDCHPRLVDHWAARDTDSQPSLPTPEQWARLKAALELADDAVDAEVTRLNDRKGDPGDAWQDAEVVGEYGRDPGGFGDLRFAARDNLDRAPASPEAEQWEGWGTALKPAHEPIVVARKPFRGTVEAQVLATGTGALNIDACRIGLQNGEHVADIRSDPANRRGVVGEALQATGDADRNGQAQAESVARTNALGRWPANVVLIHAPDCRCTGTASETRQVFAPEGPRPSVNAYGEGMPRSLPDGTFDAEYDVWDCAPGCPVAMLDELSGELTSGAVVTRADTIAGHQGAVYGTESRGPEPVEWYGDGGGAARFFYSAKAAGLERHAGLDEFGGGEAARNVHPTVKPIDLMRWLIRLVAPKGAVVLDPFAGSGSTGCAAMLEGVRFVGVEQDDQHAAIARARIRFWSGFPVDTPTVRVLAQEATRRRIRDEATERQRLLADAGQLDLLAGLGDV